MGQSICKDFASRHSRKRKTEKCFTKCEDEYASFQINGVFEFRGFIKWVTDVSRNGAVNFKANIEAVESQCWKTLEFTNSCDLPFQPLTLVTS